MKETILVIDDDDPIHIILEKMLGDEFSLLQAKDAQEGIDTLSKNQVDLIITDIHMPGLSGLEFLESLMSDAEKKTHPHSYYHRQTNRRKRTKSIGPRGCRFYSETTISGRSGNGNG